MQQVTEYCAEELSSAIVDSMPDLTLVISGDGAIQCTNTAWREFGQNRDCKFTDCWLDVNYLDVCDTSTSAGNEYAYQAALGIRQIINGERPDFYLDYPCFSPDQNHWYRMHVQPMQQVSQPSYLIRHQEITDTIQYIDHLETLAITDALTGLSNRRCFDTSLEAEWRRDTRAGNPLSLLLLDIDEFKLYNDQYGHMAGDYVLRRVASVLKRYARRPGDCAARYGGEEFALVLGNTGPNSAIKIARSVLQEIRGLAIEHAQSAKREIITVSLGVATTYPLQGLSDHTITNSADQKMYRAKSKGGDILVM